MCCCVCTFTSLIWLFGDTSDFPRISRYTFQPISYLPNIHLKHGLISAFVCFVRFSFHFKKKNSRKPRNPLTHTHTHTHTSGQTHNARCRRVLLLLLLPRHSTGNLLQTQYDLFDRLKKIRLPLNTLKRWEPRGRSIERQFIHYGRHLQRKGDWTEEEEEGTWGNNRYTIEEEKEMRGGGGRERGFRRLGWSRIGLFKFCLYVQRVSKKNTSGNHQSPRDQSFILLDFVWTRSLFPRPELCLICRIFSVYHRCSEPRLDHISLFVS